MIYYVSELKITVAMRKKKQANLSIRALEKSLMYVENIFFKNTRRKRKHAQI